MLVHIVATLAAGAQGAGPQVAPSGLACGTRPVLASGPSPVSASATGDELEVADAYGDFEGRTRLTPHFAIKWGPDLTPDDEDLDTLAAILEEAHEETVRLGFQPGVGQDRWYSNVYVGGTGGDGPPINFSGGYATLDSSNNSMVVMSWDVIDNLTHGTADRTAADWQSGVIHEVMHLSHLGAYSYAFDLWFWEASANWFSNRMRPANQDVLSFGSVPTLLPELAISTYEPTNVLTSLYPYGAWIWLSSMERALGHDYLAEMWENRGFYADPLDEFDDVLPGHDGDLEAMFVTYAVERSTGDFAEGDGVFAYVEENEALYEDIEHRVARMVSGPTDGWLAPRTARQPQAFASNLWIVDDLGSGNLELMFEADSKGTLGTRARFSVVVLIDGERHDLPVDRISGTQTLPLTGGEAVELIVVSHPREVVEGEVFPYAFDIQVSAPEVPEPEAEVHAPAPEAAAGCGCQSGLRPSMHTPWLELPWILRRTSRT